MASITNKPTIVIVPGGWHPPLLYSALSEALQSAAYPVLTIHHPSFNPSLPLTDGAGTCAADAIAARDTILPLIEEGREIIIYAHSWGGIPAGGCARGLSKSTREREGKKGGVLGLVYNSALLVPEGMSVLEFFGGNHAPFVVEGHPAPNLCTASPPVPTFFNDISDLQTAERLAAQLLPHAQLAFESPAPAPAWAEPDYQGRLGFIKNTLDAALPLPVQNMFLERCEGTEWVIREVEAGHSPFISKPKELVELIREFEQIFRKAAL